MEILNYTPVIIYGAIVTAVILLVAGVALDDVRRYLRLRAEARRNRPSANRVIKMHDERERAIEAELQAMLQHA